LVIDFVESQMQSTLRVKHLWMIVVTGWGIAALSGSLFLGAYAARPGESLPSLDRWPEGSSIPRDEGRATLLIFLHPRCPCSLAGLDELRYVLDRSGGRVSTQAVVLATARLESLGSSAIDQALAELPEISVYRDAGGAESRRFNVTTSGHVLLYDGTGRLVFSGGITAARGHHGDSFGRTALLDWIWQRGGDRRQCPVFGCALGATRSQTRRESRP
jgi:hypothetical protein